jgi:hypothetical protein
MRDSEPELLPITVTKPDKNSKPEKAAATNGRGSYKNGSGAVAIMAKAQSRRRVGRETILTQ